MTTESSDALHEALMTSLRALPKRTGMPIAFGGVVGGAGAPLDAFVGARGCSLHGLLIEPTEGLGGRAIAERRPVATTMYQRSDRITHRYDREVTAEGIVSLLAVPIVDGPKVRAVVYVGDRRATRFGDTVVREAVAVGKSLSWEIAVLAEVERRLERLRAAEPALPADERSRERAEVLEAIAELRTLSRAVQDPGLARKVDAIALLLAPGRPAPDAPHLSPRQLDVLGQIALGRRNGEIADRLGLTEATVKSYASDLMRRLGADSRYEAVVAARRLGIPT